MLKEPSTIKMRRLLEQLIESDPRGAPLIRELQQDARKVLGLNEPAEAAPRKKAAQAAPRKKPTPAAFRKKPAARK